MSGAVGRWGGGAVLTVLLVVGGARLDAQNPTPVDTVRLPDSVVVRQRPRGDSIRPVAPITPGGAFLRSLVIPGWGQAILHRNVTGGVFLAFEGIAMTMYWKANWQLDYAIARGKNEKSHRQERQDWLVLLIFNHLMSAAEAYVSSHLYDFPEALKLQPLPNGATGLGITVRF